MRKFPKVNRNIILSIILLAAIAFSVITIVQSAALNPGHAWATLDDASLPVANGGTGLSTFGGTNTVLYTSAANTLTNVAVSTAAGQFLQTTAAGGAPTWLTTLGVANGGTGLATLTTGNVILGAGTGNVTFVSPATSGNVLTANGSTWTSAAPSGGGAPTTATYITQTADATLSAEQALSTLATGYMKVTTGTGVITSTGPYFNQSVTTPAAGFAADTYLVGSSIAIPSNALKIGTRYHLIFNVTKTAAGVATPILNIRFGTGGVVGDASKCALTFTLQTAATDTGTFEVWATFRTVGSGTAAVLQCAGQRRHGASITGLGTLVGETKVATSAGFDSTVANSIIGASVNGGTAAVWTITLVQAELSNTN